MSVISKLTMLGAAGAGGGVPIQEAFSADLYAGSGTTQTITNGIDLSGEGGLVWFKSRNSAQKNEFYDTARGVNKALITSQTAAEQTETNALTSFNSDGFTAGGYSSTNASGVNYVSWTFRKASKFFDIVTYTGNSSTQVLSHNLGVKPGMVIVKSRSFAADWFVWHVGIENAFTGNDAYLILNAAGPDNGNSAIFPDNAASATTFTLGSNANVNGSGSTYVAYFFAHDTAASGLIQCGLYSGNDDINGPVITLGWEPQFLIVKNVSTSANWVILDSARSTSNPRNLVLIPNLNNAETDLAPIDFLSTGFQPKRGDLESNDPNDYVYMAIRAEGV